MERIDQATSNSSAAVSATFYEFGFRSGAIRPAADAERQDFERGRRQPIRTTGRTGAIEKSLDGRAGFGTIVQNCSAREDAEAGQCK